MSTIRLATLFVLAPVFFSISTQGQSLNTNWEKDLTVLMDQFMSCTSSSSDSYSCSALITESVAKVYKLNNALYSEKSKRYLHLKEVSQQLAEASQWTLLGHAYEQKALTEAQDMANAKKAVIAVYTTTEGVSHVAVILPGELQYSGTWGFQVPNSASFVLSEPSKSYVNKGLSYAFARNMIKDVKLYGKKY
jgi:hypothetical protein